MGNSCYDILGITPDALEKQIKEAYRQKAKEYHPDTYEHANLPPDIKKELERKFAELTDAMEEALDRLQGRSRTDSSSNSGIDVKEKKLPFSISCLEFEPNNRSLVIGGSSPEAYIWQFGGNIDLEAFKAHSNQIYALRFVLDGDALLTAGDNKTVRMWRYQKKSEIRRFKGHEDEINCLATRGNYALSGSDDGNAYIWDCTTGQRVREFSCSIAGTSINPYVMACAISQDLDFAVTGDDSGEVIIWRTEDGSDIHTIDAHSSEVSSIAFSPNSNVFFTVGDNKTIRIWSCTDGEKLGRLKGHTDNVNVIAVSENGQLLFSAGDDCTLRIWDIPSATELVCLERHESSITALALSPSGRHVATGSNDGTVCLWRLST
ncbi:MAG: DnaJ domain-containing protein [Scytonema sp. CRU_2_7]|nr:DnaJ domain-containing protein [Scytonema sp. CRU_2_7]